MRGKMEAFHSSNSISLFLPVLSGTRSGVSLDSGLGREAVGRMDRVSCFRLIV